MKGRDHGSCIEDIIEHMNYAEEFIKNLTFEEFVNDKKTVLSVTKCIEVVGEATKHIPDSIRKKYPEIPWNEWRESETQEFPELRPKMQKLLNDIDY